MSVNNKKSSIFSRTPQITIPIAESQGVPIGLSFIAGYGKDMMLVNFCNELQAMLVRNNAINV